MYSRLKTCILYNYAKKRDGLNFEVTLACARETKLDLRNRGPKRSYEAKRLLRFIFSRRTWFCAMAGIYYLKVKFYGLLELLYTHVKEEK
jgi:hypothetical protein